MSSASQSSDSNVASTNNLVDISSSEYATRRRQLMALIRDLRAVGADAILPLPCVTVIGGQSAGKSSLVEAVSKINVPRDSGTCTRCPTECSLLSTEPGGKWSCQISLRLHFDSRGERQFRTQSIHFGPLLADAREVEVWLRRAQGAILSPHRPHTDFHDLDRDQIHAVLNNDSQTLKFSQNAVVVDIKDPEATDLLFIDLPGLIQNETDEAIETVREAVTKSIALPHSIILVTIPISDDMENQYAVRLARDADPQGDRTLGVLTKPDMLGEGALGQRDRWTKVLEGGSHYLRNGYYCVRLPDDAQRARHIGRAEAETTALEWFRATTPWSQIMQRHPNRFGVENFLSAVSVLLTERIEQAVPVLKELVVDLLRKNNEELGQLPPPIFVDPITEVITLINQLDTAVKAAVDASSSDKGLVHRNKAHYQTFKNHIWATAPDFRPFTDPLEYHQPSSSDPDLSGAGAEPVDIPSRQVWGLFDVRKVIKEQTGWEWPNYLPFDATKHIVKKSLAAWESPALKCFDDVFKTVSELLNTLVRATFARFRHLEVHMSDAVSQELLKIKSEGRSAVMHILALEAEPLFTQNDHYYRSARAKWLSHYTMAKHRSEIYLITRRTPAESVIASEDGEYYRYDVPEPVESTSERTALAALAKLGYSGLTVETLARLHPPDRHAEELAVMADVRAYFQIAYKRIIDYVPLAIERSLNRSLAGKLQEALVKKLNLAGDDARERIAALLSEDPAIASRRIELQQRQKTLETVQRKLNMM